VPSRTKVEAVKWVKPKNLAGALYFLANRNVGFVQYDANPSRLRDLAQRTGDSSAGRVAKHMDVRRSRTPPRPLALSLNREFLSAKEFHAVSGNSDSVAPAGLGYKAFTFFSGLL